MALPPSPAAPPSLPPPPRAAPVADVPTRRPISGEQVRRALRMRAAGASLRACAQRLDVAESALGKRLKRFCVAQLRSTKRARRTGGANHISSRDGSVADDSDNNDSDSGGQEEAEDSAESEDTVWRVAPAPPPLTLEPRPWWSPFELVMRGDGWAFPTASSLKKEAVPAVRSVGSSDSSVPKSSGGRASEAQSVAKIADSQPALHTSPPMSAPGTAATTLKATVATQNTATASLAKAWQPTELLAKGVRGAWGIASSQPPRPPMRTPTPTPTSADTESNADQEIETVETDSATLSPRSSSSCSASSRRSSSSSRSQSRPPPSSRSPSTSPSTSDHEEDTVRKTSTASATEPEKACSRASLNPVSMLKYQLRQVNPRRLEQLQIGYLVHSSQSERRWSF